MAAVEQAGIFVTDNPVTAFRFVYQTAGSDFIVDSFI
mgnify:CR=1 FL=1